MDHQRWIEGIVRYARLVTHSKVINRAWLEGSKEETSVFWPGELIAQIFDDLDADRTLADLEASEKPSPLLSDLKRFVHAVDSLSAVVGDQYDSASNQTVLRSKEWQDVVSAADQLVSSRQLREYNT